MIRVSDLTFSYTKAKFIDKMNFEVNKGEIFGFLGPSGAGKSTLQKILIGSIKNYQGNVMVMGKECKNQSQDFYEHIGIDFEYSTMYEKFTAHENIEFFSSLYKYVNRDKTEALIKQIGLEADMNKKVSEFSKGMRSRLNFVKAIVHNPELIFLDEPTSGLDPNNSRIMKNLILAEKESGKTIVITTHNMNDATELCDKVAFIVNGEIVLLDNPHEIIMKQGASTVHYTYMVNKVEMMNSCQLSELAHDDQFLELIQNGEITSIHSSEPNLNDIFIKVTGEELI